MDVSYRKAILFKSKGILRLELIIVCNLQEYRNVSATVVFLAIEMNLSIQYL